MYQVMSSGLETHERLLTSTGAKQFKILKEGLKAIATIYFELP